MKTYKWLDQASGIVAVIDEDGVSRTSGLAASLVPEGAGILPADPVAPVIPQTVTMRQARLALLQSGMLIQVNAAVAAIPGDEGEAARIEWEFSSTVERNRPLVQGLAVALGMTEQQLDDLFTLAATL